MKPRLSIDTKDSSKKPKIEVRTPKHKYSSSLLNTKPLPGTTRAKPSFSSFLSPNISKSLNKTKHLHTMSQQFPISPQSPRLIKVPKFETIEDRASWRTLSLPTTAEVVCKSFKSHLSAYEQVEILNFPEIFFIGIGASKLKSPSQPNHGFDDDSGDYKITIGDHVAYRYEILQQLGSGSFGKVIKVLDCKTKTELALKIIKNKPRFHEQAREEIEVLEYLKTRDNEKSFCIIHIIDNFIFRNHVCLTFELLSINLYQFIKANHYQGLPLASVKKLGLQILQALRLMDRYKVIHCDLKPENILLHTPDSTDIKVIDFGSACFYEKRIYTYIQSRYYRAPEVILGLDYSTAIDMWSFGCILAELFTGRPIFAGESEGDQIGCMVEILGLPPLKLLNKGSRKSLYFDNDGKPKAAINPKGKRRIPGGRSLKEVLKGAEEGLIHLIAQCFEWDQLKRISPDEALLHPWLLGTDCHQLRYKHAKTQSESVLKLTKLFTIKETPLA